MFWDSKFAIRAIIYVIALHKSTDFVTLVYAACKHRLEPDFFTDDKERFWPRRSCRRNPKGNDGCPFSEAEF